MRRRNRSRLERHAATMGLLKWVDTPSLDPTRPVVRRSDRSTLEAVTLVPLASPSRGSLFDCSSWGDATVGKIPDVFEPADALVEPLGFSFEEGLLLFDFDLDRVITGHVFHQEA